VDDQVRGASIARGLGGKEQGRRPSAYSSSRARTERGAEAVAGGAAGGVGGALRELMKRSLLSRRDAIFVALVACAIGPPLLAMTQRPSVWVLVVDAVLSASLGLMVAMAVAAVVRHFENRQ
jgi:hypothetical protein